MTDQCVRMCGVTCQLGGLVWHQLGILIPADLHMGTKRIIDTLAFGLTLDSGVKAVIHKLKDIRTLIEFS